MCLWPLYLAAISPPLFPFPWICCRTESRSTCPVQRSSCPSEEAGAGDCEDCWTLACPAHQHKQGARPAFTKGTEPRVFPFHSCTCVLACMFLCVQVHTCVYVHILMCVHIPICIYTYTGTCVYVHVCVHAHACAGVHVCVYAHRLMSMHTLMCAGASMCVHTHV